MACPTANPAHPVFKTHLDPNHVCPPPSTQWSGHPELLFVTPACPLSILVFPTPQTNSPFLPLPQRTKRLCLTSAAETDSNQCGPGWSSGSSCISAGPQERLSHAAGLLSGSSDSQQSALCAGRSRALGIYLPKRNENKYVQKTQTRLFTKQPWSQ